MDSGSASLYAEAAPDAPASEGGDTIWTEEEILNLHEAMFIRSIRGLFDQRASAETKEDILSWIRDDSTRALSFRACCFAVQVNWEEMQDHLLSRHARTEKLLARVISSSGSGRHITSTLTQLSTHFPSGTEATQFGLWPEFLTEQKWTGELRKQKGLIRHVLDKVSAGVCALIPQRFVVREAGSQMALPL